MCNPWSFNLGKLVVPNIFVNVELVKLFSKHYNIDLKSIYNLQGEPFIHVSKIALCEVFNLSDTCDELIVHEDLEKEYWRMDTTYKGWRLTLNRPRKDGDLVPLEDNDEPPFLVDLFEPYLKHTYFSVCQALGIEASEFILIGPMVIAVNIQCHNARPFDYASHIFKGIDSGLMEIKNGSPTLHFTNYSIFMHMILYHGQEIGMWPKELKITQSDKED